MEEARIRRAHKRPSSHDSLLKNYSLIHHLNDGRCSELVTGVMRPGYNNFNDPSSELVVGVTGVGSIQRQKINESAVNVAIKTDAEEFSSTFKPQPPEQHTGTTLWERYPKIIPSTDILYFPEPTVNHTSQHLQHKLTEHRGVIYPPSFDVPLPVQPHVNDWDVLDVDNLFRLTTRGEVLEYCASNDTYKVRLNTW